MSKHDRLQKLVEKMTNCLAELDTLQAHVAGAHVDSALQALQRQFPRTCNSSNPDQDRRDARRTSRLSSAPDWTSRPPTVAATLSSFRGHAGLFEMARAPWARMDANCNLQGCRWGNVSMALAEQVMRNRAKAMRLIGIANELLAMARELEMGGQNDNAPLRAVGSSAAAPAAGQDHPVWVELARQTYEDRRRRTKIFQSEELFGEPAWDILLDLFIAAKERRRVSVTSACIGSAVPSTTALRWISILERLGLLTREADPGDARRVYVRLSPQGYEAMLEYFSSSSRSVVLLDDGNLDASRRR